MTKYSATLSILLVLAHYFPSNAFSQSILQKRIDATSDGDTLYVEQGDYVSDNSITLTGRKKLTLVFEEGAIVTCTSQFQDLVVIQNCSDIQIINGTFRHRLTDEASNFGSGIYIFQSENIRVINADLENNGVRGIYAQAVHNLELTNCLIQNNSASAFLFQERNTNIILKGNQYERNGPNGDDIFDFKKNPTDTDPFEPLEERALTPLEMERLNSMQQMQKTVFKQLGKAWLYPAPSKTSYDSLHAEISLKANQDSIVYPAWLEETVKLSHTTVWLSLPASVAQSLCTVSGLSKFDTKDACAFFKYDEPDFTNISPKAFLKGIQNEEVYINENEPSGIPWKCDPELEQMVLELRGKGIQQIAEAQETVIYRLLQVWEKYQSAGLTLDKLRFELVGKCRFMRSAFHPEAELLDAHLLLDDYYLATMRIPMNASDMKHVFFDRDDFTVYFTLLIRPGFKQVSFNIGDRNTPSWTLPNPTVLAEPVIEFRNHLGHMFRFTTHGLLGQLWPDGFSRKNWDKACPSPTNNSYQYVLLGGMNPIGTSTLAKDKTVLTKNITLYKSADAIGRIIRTMEFYSKNLNDCYFGLSNQAKKLMENIFPLEQKDKQYLVFQMESEAEAELVKKALLAKGMRLTSNFTKGQSIFCFAKQLK